MRITEIKCETAAGFALPAAGLSPALGENREIRAARLSLSASREKKALRRPLARLDSIEAGSVVAASSRVVRKSCVAQIFSVAAARAETIRGECFPLCGNPRKSPAARRVGD